MLVITLIKEVNMKTELTGRALSGKARAASLSSERRKEIAKNALTIKNDKTILKATHGNVETPLIIGDIKIPCYVLVDKKRVLLQKNMAIAIGLSEKSGGSTISNFTANKWISNFIDTELQEKIENPIKFRTPQGQLAHGYDASILIDICNAVLKARDNNKLQKQQSNIVLQCDLLIRSVAKVGIIALVDEATGYQEDREKNALAKILEEFIAKELKPWVKTFSIDYYKQLCRLRDVPYSNGATQLPQYFGHLTNNIVYKRLAPGVLAELKNITPKSEAGNKTARYFQSLSTNKGYRKLTEHLGSVVTLMKLSDDYEEFEINLNRIHPLFEDA